MVGRDGILLTEEVLQLSAGCALAGRAICPGFYSVQEDNGRGRIVLEVL